MLPLFNIPKRASKAESLKLAKKANETIKNNVSPLKVRGGNSLIEKISAINLLVSKNLSKYENKYKIITKEKDLENYISKAIENNEISIDTETNSLNTITCTIAGICIYTPTKKAAYIPLHHVNYVTGIEIENQISDEFVTVQLLRLKKAKTKIIMFNAKFDIRVLKNQLNVELECFWDGYIAGRLLNENEPQKGLKQLHKKYCMQNKEDAFSFDDLFRGVTFTQVPINSAYIYAARDAEITYELYKFQEPYLTENNNVCIEKDLVEVAKLYREIEIPLINVVADMEDTGISFDFEYAKKLSVEYNEKLKKVEEKFYTECEKISSQIENYRKQKGNNCKLKTPINIASSVQIAILLYDILKIDPVDKEKKRGTGEEILLKIKHPICKIILEYRGIAKLLSTYIDKMPKEVNPKTKKIHTNFNQMGADTGRFSSSEPNMQNIPAQNNEIRKMFIASENHVLLSSDYSAQEPRITAHMSEDEKMIQAYQDGKDLYVEIASIAFQKPYEECKEIREDGSRNEKGKERRNAAKAIVLGVCYGKGVPAIAEDLGITRNSAQLIYDKIMFSFPGLKQFMLDSEEMARTKGFVTTVWGRKRRLPNMQLEPYEFSFIEQKETNFNPFFNEVDEVIQVNERTKQKYLNLLNNSYNARERNAIKENAKKENIFIKDNGGFIAEATRQCVNSRIQGSAADQTKKAMILVGKDEKLKKLGFKLLLVVHDELIGECPTENAKQVSERLSKLMIEAAKDLVVPSKCDVEITKCWYGEPLEIE